MVSALAIAASAGAFFLSTGLGVVWPLAWLAPIPVLLLAFRRSWRVSALVAFLAYFLGSFTILGLFRAGGLIIFAGPLAIAFAIAVLSARSAVGRVPPWMASFVFPSVFTAYEFLYSLISPNGTYWSLGYSQTDFLPVLQVVSVAGLWGVIFLMTLVPSAVAVSWHRRAPWVLAPALALLVLAVGYGAVRLSRSANEGGAEIVVFPEKLIVVTAPEADAVMKIFSDASRAARVTLVVGLNRSGGSLQRNVAVVLANGEVVAEYEKHHLVPLIEAGFAPGTTPRLFSGPGAQWGVAICKDMDFPSWSREYGRRGVRLLAVPALDFVRDGRMHSRMAVTRGVENGFAVARAAGQGVVTLSDAYGRVLAEQQSAVDGRLVQRLSAGPGATVYARYGDWFGWTTVLLLVGAVAVMRASSERQSPTGNRKRLWPVRFTNVERLLHMSSAAS